MMLVALAPAAAQRSTPLQVLHPSGAAADQFGQAVAVDGDTMVVGAPSDDVGGNSNQGTAHVYRWTGSGWTLEATLTAADGLTSDNFGTSVAVSGDTVIVGASGDNIGANSDQGSAYIFTRAGTTWTQQARITATGGATFDNFGNSVAISGDTVVVAAFGDDVGANPNQGSAYVFTRAGTTWTQQAQLTATGGAADDQFGISVALSGDTAIVGAWLDDVGTNQDQGSAYVFTRSGTSWTQQAQLVASDGGVIDSFGISVAISGDSAIVGAWFDDVGANTNQGSAYVFTRSGTAWTQQARLEASDGETVDNFGISVALSGDTAVIGAYLDRVGANNSQGSSYVFARSGTTWTQQAQLVAPDGAASDNFGISVAVSGDTAAVGSYGDDVGGAVNRGSAWVFSRIGSTWLGPDLTLLSAAAGADTFGVSIAISDNTAIIGAALDDVGANINQGSAYVFTRAGTAWTQQAQLTASDGAADDEFGTSVTISGDTAIVGAYLKNVGANVDQGAAYVFTRSGTVWTQQALLTGSGGAHTDYFGYAVALSGDTAIVGATGDDVGANVDQGSAYIFIRSGATWTQQTQFAASDGAASDFFGFSVAITGDTAIVGAYLNDVGANINQGSA
ncbi:MAG: FG-GAP repeat protein [Planctomycetota bacterium]|nr:FG-GAP repeat protein [Planctomycetota bacterium]